MTSRPPVGETHGACTLQCGAGLESLSRELAPLGLGGKGEKLHLVQKGRRFGKSTPSFKEGPRAGALANEDLTCPWRASQHASCSPTSIGVTHAY